MKRVGNLLPAIAALDNLYLAFWKASRHKVGKPEVEAYRKELGTNISHMHTQLLNGTVTFGNYSFFKILDPKERIICAAAFPERVLHHAIMNICGPIFERFQIYDSYATRLGKGTHAAVARAMQFHGTSTWFAKMDVSKYFDHIDHSLLKQLLRHRFKDVHVLTLLDSIIDSYAATVGKGLPIGNLTSQYFANFYLGHADHFVKEKLGAKGYVRYMDDMLLYDTSREGLLYKKAAFEQYLAGILALHLKPATINTTAQGVPFLGYVVWRKRTTLNLSSRKRFVTKLKNYYQQLDTGSWQQSDFQRHCHSLFSFVRHCDSAPFVAKRLATLQQDLH